jgi:hypothetical protein
MEVYIMKNITKIVIITFIFTILSTPCTTSAATRRIYSDDNKLYVVYPGEEYYVNMIYGLDNKERMPQMQVRCASGGAITGKYSYPNYSDTRLGTWDLKWVFNPDDQSLAPISGVFKVHTIMRMYGTTSEDDDDVPSLMSPTISMEIGTTYTPQIINNIQDSDYLWTTSDKSVIKINKKTGKTYAISSGKATVTCKINTPYDDIFTLTTDVTVLSNTKAARIASNDVITLSKGDTMTLEPNYDASNSTAAFSSSKSSVVRAEPYTGKIIARKPGTAYITCTIINTDYEIKTIRYTVVVTE